MTKPIGIEFRDKFIIPELEEAEICSNTRLIHGDNLVMGTFAQESKFIYLRQRGFKVDGTTGAFGLSQQELKSHDKILEELKREYPYLHEYITVQVSLGLPTEYELMWNIPYQILICRALYLTINSPLPDRDDIKGMARYWNDWYNRNDEHGTEEEFLTNYERYCL